MVAFATGIDKLVRNKSFPVGFEITNGRLVTATSEVLGAKKWTTEATTRGRKQRVNDTIFTARSSSLKRLQRIESFFIIKKNDDLI